MAVYAAWFPVGSIVDPGVGGTRPAIVLEADRRWYVGPGNGLLELALRSAKRTRSWAIDWKPEQLPAGFHGRDLFAPAMLARQATDRARMARSIAETGRRISREIV